MILGSPDDVSTTAWLTPIGGPPLPAIELSCGPDGRTLGRHDGCSVVVPAEAEQVSRQHARFDGDETGWRATDLGSRWGTFVNGVKLTPRVAMPIDEGDLITIAPWTFAFTRGRPRGGLRLADDSAGTDNTIVRSITHQSAAPLAENLLHLLLESAGAIHAAASEAELAATLLEFAARGTGLPHGVVLRPTDGLSAFDVVASHAPPGATTVRASFSRSLVTAASGGEVAELSSDSSGDFGQSIVKLNVTAAICAPLMLGQAPAAYLYLDSRGGASTLRPNASAFCVALARLASLALANLKRIEIEKRQSRLDAELHAAAAAQRWIMPKRELSIGGLRLLGESRPGAYVGGDFFDVIPLPDGRVAVALGDVSGKGVSASVLMTLTQGFLHASLLETGDPGLAVTRLNAFIAPRRPASKFVTLWCAVIDSAAGELCYVDAAHGYALQRRRGGEVIELNDGGGLPVGVMEDGTYDAITVPISPGDTLVVVSDGVVEQPAPGIEPRDEFGLDGVRRVLQNVAGDPVAAMFEAVIRHAHGEDLADDATALYVLM